MMWLILTLKVPSEIVADGSLFFFLCESSANLNTSYFKILSAAAVTGSKSYFHNLMETN